MSRLFATLLVLAVGARLGLASGGDPDASAGKTPGSTTNPTGVTGARSAHIAANVQTPSQMQAALEQLKQTNQELLDLLKKQQVVLEDMQYDRRLQSRQIAMVEERLEDALNEKHQLQTKIDELETQASRGATPSSPVVPGTVTSAGGPPSRGVLIEDVRPGDTTAPDAAAAASQPPASYLPPEGSDNPPGPLTWHRLFTLKGTDNKQSDIFLVRGRNWRVLWHNQDKTGKLYENTSALFINAFPRDDTIPQRVCSKLGTGTDSTVLPGPGNYYLKIEASGGSWEVAVEDLR
jgi:hypothetical protein